METRCMNEACCGPEHTSCYVGCPVPLPDDADDGEASPTTAATTAAATTAAATMTTAAPTAGADTVSNATRALVDSPDYEAFKEYYGEFLAYSTVMQDTTVDTGLEKQTRRLNADDGAGRMCPAAPVGCYEDFFAGGNEWSQISGCEAFVGENTFCDQNPEDAETASTDVEESGSRYVFASVAFYVWMGCA